MRRGADLLGSRGGARLEAVPSYATTSEHDRAGIILRQGCRQCSSEMPVHDLPSNSDGRNRVFSRGVPRVATALLLPHHFVVRNSIEKFLQIEINAPAVAFDDILLRLPHRLMSRPHRPEPVAVIGGVYYFSGSDWHSVSGANAERINA